MNIEHWTLVIEYFFERVLYLERMATTGFNLAAIKAGIIPASMPTTKQIPIAQIRFAVEI